MADPPPYLNVCLLGVVAPWARDVHKSLANAYRTDPVPVHLLGQSQSVSQSVGFAASVCVSSVVAVFQYTDAEWELVGHSRGVELQHSTE